MFDSAALSAADLSMSLSASAPPTASGLTTAFSFAVNCLFLLVLPNCSTNLLLAKQGDSNKAEITGATNGC